MALFTFSSLFCQHFLSLILWYRHTHSHPPHNSPLLHYRIPHRQTLDRDIWHLWMLFGIFWYLWMLGMKCWHLWITSRGVVASVGQINPHPGGPVHALASSPGGSSGDRHHNVLADCPVSDRHHNVLADCPVSGRHHNVLAECPVSGRHHNVLADCPVSGRQHNALLVTCVNFRKFCVYSNFVCRFQRTISFRAC